MAGRWTIALCLFLLLGCERQAARMSQPEDPKGRYKEQIAAAARLLRQNEDWADRVEWEVLQSGDGWEVIAWRIEHPERKGPDRYLPWGYSTIQLDRRMVAVHYHRRE
jgi:hypothetical protein